MSADATIFVSIASYRDPFLPFTIRACLDQAAHPERLRFGICWQAGDEEELEASILEDPRMRIRRYPYTASLGYGWAPGRGPETLQWRGLPPVDRFPHLAGGGLGREPDRAAGRQTDGKSALDHQLTTVHLRRERWGDDSMARDRARRGAAHALRAHPAGRLDRHPDVGRAQKRASPDDRAHLLQLRVHPRALDPRGSRGPRDDQRRTRVGALGPLLDPTAGTATSRTSSRSGTSTTPTTRMATGTRSGKPNPIAGSTSAPTG